MQKSNVSGKDYCVLSFQYKMHVSKILCLPNFWAKEVNTQRFDSK